MDPAIDSPAPAARTRALAALPLVAFAGYVALLAIPALAPRGPLSFAGLAALRTARDLSIFLARAGGWVVLEVLRTAPLGILGVLALTDRDRLLDRALRVALPATWLAFAGAALAAWLAARGAPSPAGLALGLAGAALGVGAGLAVRRGRRACARFAALLAAGALALGAAAAALGAMAVDREPRTPRPPPVTSDDKRRLYDLVRGKHPRAIPAGETRTVQLSAADLDRLSAWASAVVRRGHGAVRVDAPGVLSAEASIRMPWPRESWLNVAARTRVAVQAGRPELSVLALRVGRVTVPAPCLGLLSPVLLAALRGDARMERPLASVHVLRLEDGGVTATFGRFEGPKGTLGDLMWGRDVAEVRARVDAYVARVRAAVEGAPAGDGRFAAALQAAFALARERSRDGSALEENRTALIALGAVLGHHRVLDLINASLEAPAADELGALRATVTVRGRADWVRHFTVSGALVVLSWEAPSDAAGLFKEERDAAGGSGFSFGDLLADRAGTTFAAVATRDDAAAAAVQERLARGVIVEELFPPAADLPEGIPDAELTARYGGVGGPIYRQYAAEIERRIAACAAYR